MLACIHAEQSIAGGCVHVKLLLCNHIPCAAMVCCLIVWILDRQHYHLLGRSMEPRVVVH